MSKKTYTKKNSSNGKGNQLWEQVAQIFCFAILAVFPMLMGSQGYYNITESKFYWFIALSVIFIVAAAFIGVTYLLNKDFYKRRRLGLEAEYGPVSYNLLNPAGFGKLRLTLPQMAVILYMIWGVISAIASPYPFKELWIGQSRYEGVFSLLLYGTVFLLVSSWGKWSNALVYGMAVMAVIVSAIGLAQLSGSAIMYPESYNYWNSSFISTMGNIDCYGGLMALTVPALYVAYVVIDSKWRFLCLPGMALLLLTELFTDVDSGKMGVLLAVLVSVPFILDSKNHAKKACFGGAFLMLMIALKKARTILAYATDEETGHYAPSDVQYVFKDKMTLVLLAGAAILLVLAGLLCLVKKEWKVNPKTIRLILVVLLVICVIAGIIFVANYKGDMRLLREASEALHGNLADNAGSGRGFVWKSSMQLAKERPITGIGPGGYLNYYMGYYQHLLETGATEHQLTVQFDFAHNDLIQIIVCEGYVGFVLYMAFILLLAIRAFQIAGKNPVALIAIAGFVGGFGHLFFSFSMAFVSPLFWVFGGLIDYAARAYVPKTRKEA